MGSRLIGAGPDYFLVGVAFADGDGVAFGVVLGDGVGVGLATLLERALLVVLTPGVRIGPGPWLAK